MKSVEIEKAKNGYILKVHNHCKSGCEDLKCDNVIHVFQTLSVLMAFLAECGWTDQ